MGRQIQFHAVEDDLARLLAFIRRHDQVAIVMRDANTEQVELVDDPLTADGLMTLWNGSLLRVLQRELVRRAPGRDYYSVGRALPTLELHAPRTVEWQGRPALLQGRIYGYFNGPSDMYERWFAAIARWIHSTFTRIPSAYRGSWIGPDTRKWFLSGGLLLPMFPPVPTVEWRDFVAKQDAVRARLSN
jgi:hypothetical protein